MSYKDDNLNAIRAELKKLEDFQEIEHFSDMVLSIISLSVELSQVTKQRDEALAVLEIYANMGGPGNRARAVIDKIKAMQS